MQGMECIPAIMRGTHKWMNAIILITFIECSRKGSPSLNKCSCSCVRVNREKRGQKRIPLVPQHSCSWNIKNYNKCQKFVTSSGPIFQKKNVPTFDFSLKVTARRGNRPNNFEIKTWWKTILCLMIEFRYPWPGDSLNDISMSFTIHFGYKFSVN